MKKLSKSISLLLICAMVLMSFPTAIFGQEYEYSDETLTENQANNSVKEISESDMLLYASTDEENIETSVIDNIEESEQNENLVVEEGLSTSVTEYTAGNYKYIIEGGGATVTKYLGTEGAVIIPDTIEGYQVLRIGNSAFYDKDTIGKITLGSYVTSIGDYAFRGCNALGSVSMNDGLKKIGYGAFAYCTALSSAVIPDSVTILSSDTYSDGLFAGCTALTNVVIGSGVTAIPRSAFLTCSALSSVEIKGAVTTIERSAFNSCSLSSINLPDSVTTIGMRAFRDCDNLTSINFPSSLETIGDEAFYDCAALKECNLNSGLKTIGLSAFYNCDTLTSIEIPDSVTLMATESYSWTAGTFQDCDRLKTAIIGSGVTYIPYYCFKSCDLLSNTTINGNATTIGNQAFLDCVNLTEVNLPQTLTVIGAESFENCQALTQITIPDQIAIVSEECFKDCAGLSSVTLGNNVTSIYRTAFYGCISLSDITFNKSLTNIQGGAFGKCSNLTEVSLPSSLTSIFTTYSWDGGGAFENCKSLTKVVIPENVSQISKSVFKDSPVTIYGLNGSYAQEYASANGLQFRAISLIDETLKILSLSADKSSGQKVGTPINLTASVEGGTAPYQYKFYYSLNGKTTILQNYAANNSVLFTPTEKGTYNLYVDVMDAAGKMTTKSTLNYQITDGAVTPIETDITCSYRTHVQNVGWQDFVSDGKMSGTSGKGLRLEGVEVKVDGDAALGIQYKTHVQNIGWQNFVSNGKMSGTSGKGLRLEAIEIKLTGATADQYDVYYRTHVQNVGWMSWAKNGGDSGSAGYGYRLEGIEIIVVKAGEAPPVVDSASNQAFLTAV